MICPKCGVNMPEGKKFCTKCGTPLSGGAPVPPVQQQPVSQQRAPQQPVKQQPNIQQQNYRQPDYQQQNGQQLTSGGNGNIKKILILVIIIAAAAIVALVVLFVKPGVLVNQEPQRTSSRDRDRNEDDEEEESEEVTEEETETETETEAETEAESEAETETEKPDSGSNASAPSIVTKQDLADFNMNYYNSETDYPTLEDFGWYWDALEYDELEEGYYFPYPMYQYEEMTTADEVAGSWKMVIYLDPENQRNPETLDFAKANISFNQAGSIFDCKFPAGTSWFLESGQTPDWDGKQYALSFMSDEDLGVQDIFIGFFFETPDGRQYGVGQVTFAGGTLANVALTRT
ncbi:MAG: zinc ribbon domain-containing protein [Lachnospiraceae bacterium]|nr:zinc ribbon domain-containing protein [Lachnospiraceae bacterium]